MSHPLRRRTFRFLAIAVAALAVAIVWMVWPRALPLETVTVARGEVRSTIVDLGETRVREPYAINAPASGQLRRILLEPGDLVEAGEVIAMIDSARSTPLDARTRNALEASLAQAVAARGRAKGEARLAQSDARRAADLWARRLIAEQTFLTAQTRAESAEASLREADAGVARVEAELADRGAGGAAIDIRSPIRGTVLVRHAESARPVAVGEPLLDIGDLSQLEVVAEFLSQDAALIRTGARAWIEGWGGDAVPARVRKVSPGGRRKLSALGVEEQRVDVWIDPDTTLTGIGHGFQVEARIEIAESASALRVPVESLQRDGDAWAVWRIAEGRLERTQVVPGISDGTWTAVTQGLSDGDVLVRRPSASLQAGQRARPRSATD